MGGNFWLQLAKPTRTGGAVLLLAIYAIRQGYIARSSLAWYKIVIAFLLFINRGNLPLLWHFRLILPALSARFRFDKARLGFTKASQKQKAMGLNKRALSFHQIGMDPFEIVTVRTQRVGLAEADYNLHLSNSCYAVQGDMARMQYASDHVGAPFSQDKIMTLLGSTSFVYLREIPIFTTYTTETRAVAYDDKWCYFLLKFCIPYNKKSTRPPSKLISTGEDVTVCAYLLSRLCFKRGKVNVQPEKVFTLAGAMSRLDPDFKADSTKARNWHMATKMRQARSVRDWVAKDEPIGTYMKGVETRNRKALEIIARLHGSDRGAWTELDELRYDNETEA